MGLGEIRQDASIIHFVYMHRTPAKVVHAVWKGQ
jgi:hypothetical protein